MFGMRYYYMGLLFFLFSCSATSYPEKERDISWAKKVANSSIPNLYQLNDSIYRSAQPSRKSITYLSSTGIKSVLNLRTIHSDEALLHSSIIKNYSVKMAANDFTDAEIIQSLLVIKNSPKPLLIHCRYGSDRTGVVIAMYRIIFENWTKERALAELEKGNYGFHRRFKNIPAYIKNADLVYIKKLILSEN